MYQPIGKRITSGGETARGDSFSSRYYERFCHNEIISFHLRKRNTKLASGAFSISAMYVELKFNISTFVTFLIQ
jgi:hypothetical protein